MAKSARSEAERDELRRQDRERLEQAIRELQTSDGWRAWLRARALLHGYSLNNTLLIALQARQRGIEATHVAGFRTWLKLGRCVRRGEKGLRILAPITIKQRDENDENREERRVRFRPAHVFDISQTDPLPGADWLPLDPPRASVSGDSHAHLLAPLQGLAAQTGYTVTYEPLRQADGLCDRANRRLRIRNDLAPNARVATLIHELGHALIDPSLELGRAVEEVVVEAVAYIVCAAAGLDSGCDSVPYIASWGQAQAAEQVAAASKLIDSVARRIEQAIAASEARSERAVA